MNIFNLFKKKPSKVVPEKKYKIEEYTEEAFLSTRHYKVLNSLGLELFTITRDEVALYDSSTYKSEVFEINEYLIHPDINATLTRIVVNATDAQDRAVILKSELIQGFVLLKTTQTPVTLKKQRTVEV